MGSRRTAGSLLRAVVRRVTRRLGIVYSGRARKPAGSGTGNDRREITVHDVVLASSIFRIGVLGGIGVPSG